MKSVIPKLVRNTHHFLISRRLEILGCAFSGFTTPINSDSEKGFLLPPLLSTTLAFSPLFTFVVHRRLWTFFFERYIGTFVKVAIFLIFEMFWTWYPRSTNLVSFKMARIWQMATVEDFAKHRLLETLTQKIWTGSTPAHAILNPWRTSLSLPSFLGGRQSTRFYEERGHFPLGAARAPDDEIILDPPGESIVFHDFSKAGFRIPCHYMISKILERFGAKIHQLTPNAFVQLSKFFWVVPTFEGMVNVA